MRKIAGSVFALCFLFEGLSVAATINVTSAQGSGCTVENAIATLNAGTGVGGCGIQGTGAVTINVPSGTFFVQGVNVNFQRSATLAGTGLSSTTIQFSNLGGQFDSAFVVNGGLSVTMKNLTLRGVSGNRLLGLANFGDVTLTSMRVTSFGYSGMSQFGTGRMDTCTVDHNGGSITFLGGGINFQGDSLTITKSSITNNTASLGGGIYSSSPNSGLVLTVTASLIAQNTAVDQGGGIYCENEMEVAISTINANVARNHGGGIRFDSGGEFHLKDSTVSDNSVQSSSGGGGGLSIGAAGTPVVNRNIISNNRVNGSVREIEWSRTVSVGVYNLIRGTAGWDPGLFPGSDHNKVNVDPLLQALQNQGGPTSVRPITTASPAFNAIPLGSGEFTTDQRGFRRPARNAYDMGAYELQ